MKIIQRRAFLSFVLLMIFVGDVVAQDHEEKAVIKMTKADFLEKVWNYEKDNTKWHFLGDKPAIIDFYADWCGPCRKAAPILEEVAQIYKGRVDIYKVDTQVEKVLSGNLGIRGLPTFLYIPVDGEPAMSQGVGRTTDDIKKGFVRMIEELLLRNEPKETRDTTKSSN
ncbi:MAG: thioredoxin family protein [Bacteroidales bacterium]